MSPDTHAECHLLLAVVNEDWEEANRLLSGMSQPERHRLMEHARVLRAGIIDGRFDGYDNQPVLTRAICSDEPT